MRWPRRPRRRTAPTAAATADPATDTRPRTLDTDLANDRARMVAEQLEARGIRDPELLDAFRRVPRHAFVDGDDPYGDHAMPLDAGQTISQPYIVARMTSAARPTGPMGWRDAPVLEIGTGSGYQAAILAELGANVTTIERHESLATEARDRLASAGYGPDRAGNPVRIEVGDGTEGWPDGAPYRSILVTAAGPSVPTPLLQQLSTDGGRLVMPVGGRSHQFLTLVTRHGSDLERTELDPVVFVPLIGRHGVEPG